jgi:hypothetical protein
MSKRKRDKHTLVAGSNLCPMTNKAKYDTHEQAIEAGLLAVERFNAGRSHHEAPPAAVYECVLYCGGFHLTKDVDGKPVENLLATYATTKEA